MLTVVNRVALFFTHGMIGVFGTIRPQIGPILQRANICLVFVMGVWCDFCEYKPLY